MDETRDDSFTLLSSMSPKIDKGKKKVAKKKAPSRLALKSTLRRSSFYDKLPPTLTNKNIEIVDGSTENSSDTGSSDKPFTLPISSGPNLQQNDVLSKSKFTNIIKWIDGIQSSIQEDVHNMSTFSTVSSIQGDHRTDNKFGAVNSTFADGILQRRFEEFFVKVSSQIEDHRADKKLSKGKNGSFEDEVFDDSFKLSRKMEEITVHDSKKNEMKKNEKLVNSNGNSKVMIDSSTKKVIDPLRSLKEKYVGNGHNLFKEFENSCQKRDNEIQVVENENTDNSIEEVIDDSFEVAKKKNVTNCINSLKTDNNNEIKRGSHENITRNSNDDNFMFKGSKLLSQEEDEEVLIIEDSFEANKENIEENGLDIEEDCLDILDKLYGDQWRKNREQVLPRSEPRLKKPTAKPKEAPKTEFKPRILSKYKSPHIDSERQHKKNVANIFETARRNAALKPLWVSKLKGLCDSETDEDEEGKSDGLSRVRLDFGDTDLTAGKTETKGHGLTHTKSKFEQDEIYNNDDGGIISENYTDRKINDIYVNTKSRKMDYRERKISSSSDDEYYSFSDFDDIGLSLADKLKGKTAVKNKKLPKNHVSVPIGIKLISSSSSDSLGSEGRTKAKNLDKKTERIQIKTRKISSSSSCDTDEKISEFENILKRVDISSKGTAKPSTKKSDKPPSFLASLSQSVPLTRCEASARIFRTCYKRYKEELLKRLFKMFNENVFDNSIPSDTVIDWSDRMRGTAGYCACKKITRRTGKVERSVRLVLSTKVLDSADRLRDTLVHEMCHAATWIVNQVSDGHGPYWKSWAAKAMRVYPALPAIKRCHDYSIDTKYTYRCTECKYSFGRHSKSVDLTRKRCGYCYGKFELLLNKVTKNGEKKAVQATPKKEPTGFALFVKQNYAQYKNPNLKHGEVMKLLGTKFQEIKVSNS